MLVTPNCVWKMAIYMKNHKQTAEKSYKFSNNGKILPPPKHILALATWGQKWPLSEQRPFTLGGASSTYVYSSGT